MATSIDQIRYRPPPIWVRLTETLLLTLAVPAVGLWLWPEDPLFLTAGFAWLALAPLLVGLRYGFVLGFGSALLTALAMAAALSLGWVSGGFPLQHATGVFLVGMIAGEFTDGWRRRLGRTEVLADYQATRLNEFVRNYHLLRVSHDQLAERLAANPYNLRDALHFLGNRFQTQDPLETRAADILNFLGRHGKFQQAALYAVDEAQQVRAPALARIGAETHSPPDEPMVRACLHERCMISLRNQRAERAADGGKPPLLAVVPLIDVDDRIWAVVTVHDMPFMAYQDTTLNLLAVLGGNLGDLISEGRRDLSTRAGDPQQRLLRKLRLWQEYARRYRLESLVVAVHLPPGADACWRQPVMEFLFEQLRVLDYPVVLGNERGERTLAILMPLTSMAGAAAYRERINRQLREQFGSEAETYGLRFEDFPVGGKMSATDILRALSEGTALAAG